MPRQIQLRPGHNCVAGQGDTIEVCGHQWSIDRTKVKGRGDRFQFVYVGKSVDSDAQAGHDMAIGESRSPALAGK